MKAFLKIRIKSSSPLATQRYGEKQNRSKPRNKSILGAYVYGGNYVIINGSKKHDKENANSN